MADTPEAIQKSKKLYLFIGMVLFFFTIVTVAVATVPWLDFGGHGFDKADAIIGLAIATFKASLVMLIFMHLNHEKGTIYIVFSMAIFFAFFLMFLTGWAFEDPMEFGTPTIHEDGSDGFYNPDLP